MKKVFMYICILFVFSFINVSSMNAECSYQERKDLLNAAKKVDFSFEVVETEEEYKGINPVNGEEQIYKRTDYSFDMKIVGVSENIFLKIYNLYDDDQLVVDYNSLTNGFYSYNIDNTSDIIKYYVDFYSENSNCYAQKIYSTTVIKPKENELYYFEICSNDKVNGSEYCKHFINKDFSKSTYKIVEELKQTINKEENKLNVKTYNFINVFKDFWYVGVLFIVCIVFTIIFVIVRKKKNGL